MSETDAPRWLTLQDLARITGFSVSYLRNDIKAGALRATLVKSPLRRRGRWRIAEPDAIDYRRSIGFVVGTPTAAAIAATA